MEKAARPWTNHPVQPLPGAVAPHRPGGPVPGPLDFSRNAMRARKQAKAVERSENAFAPKREVTEPVPVDEKLIKGIRRILNKITPTTYEVGDLPCPSKFRLVHPFALAIVGDGDRFLREEDPLGAGGIARRSGGLHLREGCRRANVLPDVR